MVFVGGWKSKDTYEPFLPSILLMEESESIIELQRPGSRKNQKVLSNYRGRDHGPEKDKKGISKRA